MCGGFFRIGLMIGVSLSNPLILHAQVASPTEYAVKAAFLYNFAKFVEWPPEAFKKSGESFIVGILGEDPFEKDQEVGLNGKDVQDKKLVFKRLSSLQEATGCHVVFISASEQERLDTILRQLQGTPVLTVSDMKKFIQRGGMVGFILESDKVGFNINRTVAESTGLKISSQLLRLARTIVKTLIGMPIG